MDLIVIIVSISSLLQYLAAYVAFRLIKTAGYSLAWVFISSALFIMGLRRTTILFRALYESDTFRPDPVSEWFGLVISILLLLGVLAMGRFFREKRNNLLALRESEWFLERAQEIGRVGSFRYDLRTGRWNGSRMLMKIFGLEDEKDRGFQEWIGLVHPDQRLEMGEYMRKEVVEKRQPFDYDYRILRANDGQLRWVHGMGLLELDKHGDPVTLVGSIQDITDRMVGVIELREREKRFRTIVDNINDGFIIHDFQGKILDCNDNECRILGYSRHEFMGLTVAQIDGSKHSGAFEEWTRVLMENGKVEFDTVHTGKDGRQVPVTVSARLISRDGRGIIQSFTRDSTERLNAEKALRDSEERFRTLAESLPQAVFETDLTGNLVYSNRSAMTMFGYSGADFRAGLNCLQMISPETRPLAAERFRMVLKDQTPTPGNEYLGLRKDRTTFPIAIYTNVKKTSGKVTGTLGIIVDTTDVKKSELDRRRLQEQFFQAQKMESIGTLAGGIAHDFNNLLGGILGSLSIMETDAGDKPELRGEITEMKALVKRGAGLTRQLLGFARKGKYDAKPQDLKDVVSLTLELFRRTRKDIVIRKDFSASDVNVLVDRSQVEQALMNLFVNAGQAMPNGGELMVRVNKTLLRREGMVDHDVAPGFFAKVMVADTGVGMDVATQQHIFEPFFTTKEAGKGTGLGLASVYGIVKNHGGFVNVESASGKGTTFTLYLPTTDLPVQGEGEVEKSFLDASGFEHHSILLVDDEEPILRTSAKALQTMGFKALTAKDGREALELFKANQGNISAVILDMVMPGLSGLETFEALRAMDPEVKVLLASGYSREGQATMLLEAGCQGFIEKPFDHRELSEKLKELLR
jgi:two-component system cell cycle sensor histidine kinase/response regulator CckA